jgi:DNA-binding NarL/FixJ family response regulator
VVDPSREVVVKAHSGLSFTLGAYRDGWAAAGIRLEFVGPGVLSVMPPDGTPVLVPAASEPDVALVRSLRREDCLRPIIAVVSDIDGHQTFRAIDSGASGVLNIRLPGGKQLGAILAACDGAAQPAPHGSRLQLAGGTVRAIEPDEAETVDPEETGRLMQLLCGTSSISAIAQQFYCSERSMYRRLRRLYEQLGVSGRSELRSRMTARKSMLVAASRSVRN